MPSNCKVCKQSLIETPSGFVCPEGHGRIIPRSAADSPAINSPGTDSWHEGDDWEDYGDDFDDHGGDCQCEACEFDRAMDDCGMLPPDLGGGCTLAGSEHCDWDCPRNNGTMDEEE